MWPLAVFLMLVVGFYWFAFMATIWWWFNAVMALWAGHYIRAAIWGCLGFGMLLWWNGTEVIPHPWDFDAWLKGTEVIPHPWDFDAWLKGSAWVVGLGALATFVRWRKKQQAMQAVPTMPVWTPPADAPGNIAPIIEVDYKRLPN